MNYFWNDNEFAHIFNMFYINATLSAFAGTLL